MIFLDTETCGFTGPIVLIQYAIDDGPVILHSPWHETVRSTIELIEMFMNHQGGLCVFNAAFDHFKLCQMYTTLVRLANWDEVPNVWEYAVNEPLARDGDCLKPQKCVDLMIVARKGKYQSTMDRSDIRIRRVPTKLAWLLADKLTELIPIDDIYFERKSDPSQRWQVFDIKDDMDNVIPEFKDVILTFAPSSALKALAKDALGIQTTKFNEVSLSRAAIPKELGFAPYAMALATTVDYNLKPIADPSRWNWNGSWPVKISAHIEHWSYNKLARDYARNDVIYTRDLFYFFEEPEECDDSILAFMVGAVRWKGFAINIPKVRKLRDNALEVLKKGKVAYNSPAKCKEYLKSAMTDYEYETSCMSSTKGIILEGIAKWTLSETCEHCFGLGSTCDYCEDGLIPTDEPHPAALIAREILSLRHTKKEVELFDKLLIARRFHAAFDIIGTLSSRMSGGKGSGLNAQGIKRAYEIRECFTMAYDGYTLAGGDYDGFEVSIADAVYKDQHLRKQILSGKKIHGLLGVKLFPTMTYDEILATKGLEGENDKYTRAKNGVFALLYGGEEYTLQTRVGVSEEVAVKAFKEWCDTYVQWKMARRRIHNKFCSMRQPNGIGTAVEWYEPAEFIESMFGFRRYFTLENKICKALFTLAEKPPKEWTKLKIKVTRRDREQSISGAVRSALFGAAFGIQGACMRAAANHEIQSPGGTITKGLQKRIWDLQPCGIGTWIVQPMNVHDEVNTVIKKGYEDSVKTIVDNYNEEYKKQIPLISMDWGAMRTWADK
ncbi:MAG: hypothetical protein B6I31_00890 [Desulfobacteraceae bacterium 4572_19]|nr:MAG: hypothetical protein B6I31_00890 [Desulfobacteraceae bacterium 4572_19]